MLGLLVSLFVVACLAQPPYKDYRVGAGIFDVTGPVTQIGFMGMGMENQIGKGLAFRLYARAFIVESIATGQRTVYMSADLCMIFGHIHDAVIEALQTKFPSSNYSRKNVLLHGTHTHSGPGGFAIHPLYDTTTLGYHQDNVNAIVNGIVNAIEMAHSRLSAGGRILINSGSLDNANTNRGKFAYAQNPLEERLQYQHNVDKEMVLLRLQDENGKDVGSINFFAVHGTSMMNNNHLVSGDNKGFASYIFERAINGWNGTLAGRGPFVAAFGQSNEGDVSPNTKGAFCTMPPSVARQPCDPIHSTCAGRNEGCQGQGPDGRQDFLNTRDIGGRQAAMALDLFNNATVALSSKFGFIQTNVDMSAVTVASRFTTTGNEETTCPGGLGDAFAAGTTDGPGAFNFIEVQF